VLLFFAGIVGADLFKLFDSTLVSLIGIIPVAIGINRIFLVYSEGAVQQEADDSKSKHEYINVIALSIANGGDNIAAYIPLFYNLPSSKLIVFAAVFVVLDFLFCLISFWLVRKKIVLRTIDAYGRVIGPSLLIILGIKIILH
jgi:cadmium resistance protein CadD (predicted permease)